MNPDEYVLTEEDEQKINEMAIARMTPEFFAKHEVRKWKELVDKLSTNLKKLNLSEGVLEGKSEEEQRQILGEETYKLMQEYLNHPLSQEDAKNAS